MDSASCQVFVSSRSWKRKRGRAELLICRFVGHQFVQPWTNRAKSRAPGLEIICEGVKGRGVGRGAGVVAYRSQKTSLLTTITASRDKVSRIKKLSGAAADGGGGNFDPL